MKVLAVVVPEVVGSSVHRRPSEHPTNEKTRFHTPVLKYVASSPRAELVNLDTCPFLY